MDMPEVIILSTQRSGTHLLESFLDAHPQVRAHGELYLSFKRSGVQAVMHKDKINIGILMYSQLKWFLELTRDIDDIIEFKLIHLLRDGEDVAKSRLKMTLGRQLLGENYKTHFFTEDRKTVVDLQKISAGCTDRERQAALTTQIVRDQERFRLLLQGKPHLEVSYNDFVPHNGEATILGKEVQSKLLAFIGLEQIPYPLHTTMIKTG